MIAQKGSVYFIKHKGLLPVKIGYSSSENPQERFNSFKISSPYGIQVLGVIITNNPQKLEAQLHKKYADKRLNGEWFNITLQDVDMEVELNNDQDEFDRRNSVNIHYLSHMERMAKLGIVEESKISIYDRIIECMDRKGYYASESEILHPWFISGADLRFEISESLGFDVKQKELKIALLNAGYKISRKIAIGWTVYKDI